MADRIVHNDFLRLFLGEDTVDGIVGLSVDAYDRHPVLYSKIADQRKTVKQKPEIVVHKALPYAGGIAEGETRSYSKMNQLWITNLYVQYFQSNYAMTKQVMLAMGKAKVVEEVLKGSKARMIALAMKKDKSFADMLNNYDSVTQVYGDAKPIGSTSQLTGDGSTFSNLALAAAAINEVSVEAAVKVIEQWTDTGGKSIKPNVKAIVAGTNLRFDAQRLLETEFTLNSNYNNKNVIVSNKVIPEGSLISPHLANDGSWFLTTDVEDGLVTFTQLEPIFDSRPLPKSWDIEMCAMDGYVHGIGDKRAIYVYPRM